MQSYIDKNVKFLKQNLKPLIIFSVVFIIGIVFGLLFSGNTSEGSILYVNAYNYHVLIFNSQSSIFSAFFKVFTSGALLSITVILFGLSVYTIPLICLVLFYRGIILGTCFILFYSISGISGVVIFIILTLPTNLIITIGLIIASVLNYKKKDKCSFSTNLLQTAKNALVSVLFSFLASIYFLLLMITVIRPISLIFWIKS